MDQHHQKLIETASVAQSHTRPNARAVSCTKRVDLCRACRVPGKSGWWIHGNNGYYMGIQLVRLNFTKSYDSAFDVYWSSLIFTTFWDILSIYSILTRKKGCWLFTVGFLICHIGDANRAWRPREGTTRASPGVANGATAPHHACGDRWFTGEIPAMEPVKPWKMVILNDFHGIEWEYHGDLPLWWFTLFKHQKDVENSWFSEENDLQMVSFPHHSTST